MHALIIVDLQRAFGVPEDVVARIRTRREDFPFCVYTQFLNTPDSLFCTKLKRELGPPDDPGLQLVLAPQPGDLVLRKNTYGLSGEQIRQLRERGVTELTVAGVDTDACVLGVMFSLWDHKIDVHLARELCWSSVGLHDAAAKIAEQQFGR